MNRWFIKWMWILLANASLLGQGLPRFNGLGLRGGVWRTGQGDEINTLNQEVVIRSEQNETTQIYFFSHLTGNWFVEALYGGGSAISYHDVRYVDVETVQKKVSPFLLGARYDWMAPRILPYAAAGTGVYSVTKELTKTNVPSSVVSIEQEMFGGLYVGGGFNVVVTSCLALNMDVKYHWVNFDFTHLFSGPQASAGLCFLWGKRRELFSVEDVSLIVTHIYPAYYKFYGTYPLAMVKVKNTVSYPVKINVKSQVKGHSVRSRETGFVTLKPGEVRDVPVYVAFGPSLLNTPQRQPAVLDLEITARAGREVVRNLSLQILVHSRNGWNGEIDKLVFFVTPQSKEVQRLRQNALDACPDSADAMKKARALFAALGEKKLRYRSDPNIPFYRDDRVQFASETLENGGGDCDDWVVLAASLLESAGIATAFVDVQDPDKSVAHLFLLFNSGLSPDQAQRISENPKRYVVRTDLEGNTRVWVPLETTLLTDSFDAAWRSGAMQYLQDGVLRAGLNKGWMRMIDLNRIR